MSDMKEQQQQKQWIQPDLFRTRDINDSDTRTHSEKKQEKTFLNINKMKRRDSGIGCAL